MKSHIKVACASAELALPPLLNISTFSGVKRFGSSKMQFLYNFFTWRKWIMGPFLYNTSNCSSICSTEACTTSSALRYWLATPSPSVLAMLPESCAKTGCWVHNLRSVQDFWKETGTETIMKEWRICNHICALHTASLLSPPSWSSPLPELPVPPFAHDTPRGWKKFLEACTKSSGVIERTQIASRNWRSWK